jgi:hypothetical protein
LSWWYYSCVDQACAQACDSVLESRYACIGHAELLIGLQERLVRCKSGLPHYRIKRPRNPFLRPRFIALQAKRQHIGNQIDAAIIFPWADFVNVHKCFSQSGTSCDSQLQAFVKRVKLGAVRAAPAI